MFGYIMILIALAKYINWEICLLGGIANII